MDMKHITIKDILYNVDIFLSILRILKCQSLMPAPNLYVKKIIYNENIYKWRN